MASGGAGSPLLVIGIGERRHVGTVLDVVEPVAVLGRIFDSHPVGRGVEVAVGAHVGGVGMGAVMDVGFGAVPASFRRILRRIVMALGAFQRVRRHEGNGVAVLYVGVAAAAVAPKREPVKAPPRGGIVVAGAAMPAVGIGTAGGDAGGRPPHPGFTRAAVHCTQFQRGFLPLRDNPGAHGSAITVAVDAGARSSRRAGCFGYRYRLTRIVRRSGGGIVEEEGDVH